MARRTLAVGAMHGGVVAAAHRRAAARPVTRHGLGWTRAGRGGWPGPGWSRRFGRPPAQRFTELPISIEHRATSRIADQLPRRIEHRHLRARGLQGGLGRCLATSARRTATGRVRVVFARQSPIGGSDDLVLGLGVDLEGLVGVEARVGHGAEVAGTPGCTSSPSPSIDAASASLASGLSLRKM